MPDSSIHHDDAITTDAEVAAALQPYIDAARSGQASATRASWHNSARIVGSVDGAFLVNTPDQLIAWTDATGASPGLESQIVSIEIVGPAAAARIEFANWAGFRFTDFFVLNKLRGKWRIIGKVFDTHGRNGPVAATPSQESEAESFAQTEAAAATIEAYVTHSRSGDGRALRPHWFDHAHIVGLFDGTVIDRDADGFCPRITEQTGAPNRAAGIASIDRSGPAASARIELNDWNAIRYTDFFVLYRTDGKWRISAKSFDAHGRR